MLSAASPTVTHTYTGNSGSAQEHCILQRLVFIVPLAPNAGAHLLPEAEARNERRLEAVRCSAWFGAVWSGLSNRFDTIDWEFPCVQLLCKRWNQLLHIACIHSGPKRAQFFSRLFVDIDLS